MRERQDLSAVWDWKKTADPILLYIKPIRGRGEREGVTIKGEKDLAKRLSAAHFRMIHTYLFLEWKPKESECYMLILTAAYNLALGKFIEGMQTVEK